MCPCIKVAINRACGFVISLGSISGVQKAGSGSWYGRRPLPHVQSQHGQDRLGTASKGISFYRGHETKWVFADLGLGLLLRVSTTEFGSFRSVRQWSTLTGTGMLRWCLRKLKTQAVNDRSHASRVVNSLSQLKHQTNLPIHQDGWLTLLRLPSCINGAATYRLSVALTGCRQWPSARLSCG